ncbi:MAG: acyltransferase family protein [Pseudomonadota bacterium]
MTYYKFLDGLRGLSIACVVIFHLFPTFLPGGFIGVDVFFVISGFLITSIIWQKIQNNTFHIGEFYASRVRRLLPAAFIVYVATFIVAFFVLMPDTFRAFGRSLTAAIFFYSNYYFYRKTGYFEAPALEKPLLHTWSLSVEEQFYLIWPILLLTIAAISTTLFKAKRIKTVIVICATLICIASLIYSQYLLSTGPAKAFYLITSRAWELMLGALLALILPHITMSKITAQSLAALGITLICTSAIFLSQHSMFPGLGALPVCLGTACLIAACVNHNTVISKTLSFGPMVGLGLISYSLYLWHWPIISLTHVYLERHFTTIEAIGLGVISILCAYVSWKYIEQPFRNKKSKLYPSAKNALAYGSLSMISLGVLGIIIYGYHGWPWRLNENIRTVYEQMATANVKRKSCGSYHRAFINNEFCNFGVPKAKTESFDIVVFGDSKADHYVPMLGKYAKEAGLSGRQVTQGGGCGAVLEIERTYWKRQQRKNCVNLQTTLIQFVAANPGLKLAVLSASWASFQNSKAHTPIDLSLDKELHKSILQKNVKPGTLEYHLRLTIEFLLKRGIAVHIIGDIPSYTKIGGLPLRCIRHAIKADKKPHCGMASEYKQKLHHSNAVFRKLANEYENVTTFIPTDILCDQTLCHAVLDDIFLYRDLGHLNAHGAIKLLEFANLPALSKE